MHVCTCFNKSVHVFPFFQAKYRREAKKKRVLTQELHNSMYVIILLMCLLSVNNAVRLVLKKHLFFKNKKTKKQNVLLCCFYYDSYSRWSFEHRRVRSPLVPAGGAVGCFLCTSGAFSPAACCVVLCACWGRQSESGGTCAQVLLNKDPGH